jgi:hypothetical protein
MKKVLLLLITVVATTLSFAQSTANYTFSTSTTGSLALDANSNAIDMSTGTTQVLATNTSQDQAISTAITFPSSFEFYLGGTRFNSYFATSNGLVQLGSTAVISGSTYTAGGGTLAAPRLSAFNGDLGTGTAGGIFGKLIGTAPNRCYVIEFRNMNLMWDSYTNDGTYQVRLYENTGVIEYVYGSMYCNTTVASSDATPEVGFSWGSAANQSLSINISTLAVDRTGTMVQNTVTAGTNITNLNSSSNGSRRVFTFTPPTALSAPSALNATSITGTTMSINWTDNSTGELGFAVYRSTDNINFTYITTTAANTVTYAATGLSFGTTYYWRLASLNEGALGFSSTLTQATNGVTLSGAKTVGPTGDYASLTAAFAAINSNGLVGNVDLQLQAAYVSSVETFPIVSSNASAVGIYNVRVYPTVTGLTITSSNTTGTLNLNGGANITFDGRVNATGSTKDLIIENTSTSGYAIQFINDAVSNNIRYCTIRGVNTNTTNGVVLFNNTTGTTGNDNNTIDNCDIRDGSTTPVNCIYAAGSITTTTLNNSGNTISNCNIYNYFAAASDHYGINISAGNTDWTITGNSFYQTSSRVITTSSTTSGVRISNSSGNNFVITNNFIGGSAASCGGTAMTYTGSTTIGVIFRGLQLTVGSTTATSVQGNTIQNLDITTGSSSSSQSGISLITGKFYCGTTSGNLIGSTTSPNSIKFNLQNTTTTTTSNFVQGILAGTGTPDSMIIRNNTIAGIEAKTTGVGFMSVRCISFQGTSGVGIIENNTIGSSSVINSITASNSTVSVASGLIGIISFGANTAVVQQINNNTIQNLRYSSTSTSGSVIGITLPGSSGGSFTCTGNIIRALSGNQPSTGTGTSASVIGVSCTASTTGGNTISQNTIHTLSNSNTSTAIIHVVGLAYNGPTTGTNLIARNFIHSLTEGANTGSTSTIAGINITGGTTSIQNNMVRLGIDSAGNAITDNRAINGINESTGTNNYYFNSVYLGGSANGNLSTFAFVSSVTLNTRAFRNNIFVNVRSNAGTGRSVAIGLGGTWPNPSGLTLNNNIYFVSGTGTVMGRNTSTATDYTDMNAWRAALGTGFDVASGFGDPNFVLPAGTNATVDLHVQGTTPAEASGAAIAAITDDFDGQTRSSLTPTDIGADAGNFTALDIFAPVISYSVLASTTSTINRTTSSFATITDVTGVNTTAGTSPRLYYKRSTDANTYVDNTSASNGWKFAEATNSTSPFDFTIDYSLLNGGTGVSAGTIVQYFVVAQDNVGTPNIASNLGGFTVTPTSVALTASAFPIIGTPNSYIINSAYTWNGTTTDYQVSTNWTPTRTTPATSDVLIFNGAVTATPTVTNIPSQTVYSVSFINNVSATLTAATAGNTLTINASTGDNALTIASGSSVNVGVTTNLLLAHGANSGQISTIAGTLTLSNAATFNAFGSVTTVTGTIVHNSSIAAAFPSASASNLIFNAGSTLQIAVNAATVPTATYNLNSTVNVTGVVAGTTFTWPASIGGLTWNCPSQTSAFSIASSVTTINGPVNIVATNTGSFQTGTSNLTTVTINGNATLTGGTWNMSGNVTVINGNLILNGGTLTRNTSSVTTWTANSITQTASNTINGTGGTALVTLNAATGNASYAGTVDGGTTGGLSLGFTAPSGTQTLTTSTVSNLVGLTINKAAGTVQLQNSFATNASMPLNLTSGILDINANTLTINGTVTGSGTIRGSSTSNIIIGGTGAMGTINFDQTTDGTTNLLNNFTLARPTSGSATLGNKLVVRGLVTLSDGALNTGGFLNLLSNASGTASIAAITGTGAISGNVVCQRYIAGGASQPSSPTPGVRGFRFLAHPFNANPALSTLITAGLSITGSGGAGNGFTANPNAGATNNPSAFSYDPTVTSAGSVNTVGAGASATSDPGWIPYGTASQTWNKFQGIRVLFRGTGTQGLDGTASYTVNPLTLSMTGAVNTGAQSFTLPATADATTRWSLVGNPYPSAVDIRTVLNTKYNTPSAGAGNIGAAAYVFNPNKANTSRGGFDLIDVSTAGNYILPMYGAVFVQNTIATSHTIPFAETNKSSSAPNLGFRTTSANNALVLNMEDGNGNVLDQTFLRFNNKATNNFESLDGGKMLNEYSIYTVSDDMNMLAIDSRKEPTVGSSIALGVQSSVARAFVLKAEEINMPVGITAYLKDKFLNTEEPILTGFSYAFSTTANAASGGAGRFEIVFKKQALPAVLVTSLEISLSPNPVSDVLNITYSNPDQTNASIRLVNSNGQVVRTIALGTTNTGKQQVNVRVLAAGNYTVELNTGKQKITKQLIKL